MMGRIVDGIHCLIDQLGRWASLLILVIMATVSFEVISRYVFNHPTAWVWLINKQLFGVFVMIAGGYTLVRKSHIRIEMLHDHFPHWVKSVVQGLTLLLSVGFLATLVWKSTLMGMEAWSTRQYAVGVFRLPLYPLKLFMPVAAFLFLLGCLATYGVKKTPPGDTTNQGLELNE